METADPTTAEALPECLPGDSSQLTFRSSADSMPAGERLYEMTKQDLEELSMQDPPLCVSSTPERQSFQPKFPHPLTTPSVGPRYPRTTRVSQHSARYFTIYTIDTNNDTE